MPKYIKAEALIDDLLDLAEANKGTYHEEGFKNAITVVEMQPTADVVERKKGKWIYLDGLDAFECSFCGRQMVRNIFDFCPWCGAQMRERRDDVTH